MIRRIAQITTAPPLTLRALFDDGREVAYDVAFDVESVPSYEPLRSQHGLFGQARLDESRTCVYWNDYIDLPSDAIYEYGGPVTA